VSILSLFWSSNLTSSNSPYWLVSNNDISPLSLGNLINNSLELSGVDLSSLSRFSLFKLLSNTEHDVEAILASNLGLEGNILIRLSE